MNTLESAKSKYPDNREINEAYGSILMQTGRKDEAREILTGTGSNGDTGAAGLIALIDDAIEMEDWGAAATYAEKLSSSSRTFNSGKAVWRAWFTQGEMDKALDAAWEIILGFP